jgi:hypothetical protein
MVDNMAEIMNTKKRDMQYGGPVDSNDYNSRIEENYQDLLYLYNKANVVDSKLEQAFERVLKDQAMLSNAVNDLRDRVSALEAGNNRTSIHSFNQIQFSRFNSTDFSIGPNELLTVDPHYNIITLPKVPNASSSKIKFYNSSAGQVVSDLFKTSVQNNLGGIDTPGAIVNTTPVYNAIMDDPSKVWSRTLISDTNSLGAAQMMFYCKIPAEFTGSLKANCLKLNPYPMHSVNVYSIEYTNKINPTLTDADGWTPLNFNSLYDGEVEAVGHVPPGAWIINGSDEIVNSGPLCFYFADLDMTAVRIILRQENYFKELNKYIYTYGLSDFDIRYDKFASSGKTILNFKAPPDKLIASINGVDPVMFNVPRSLASQAFSYRVIYPFDSGSEFIDSSYTVSNPGASAEVWIEITLNMLEDKTAPVLSDLIIDYDTLDV